MARLEGAFEQVGERLNSIDRRLESMDQRIGRLELTMESRFGLIDQRFNWLIGIIVGTWITSLLTFLFHH